MSEVLEKKSKKFVLSDEDKALLGKVPDRVLAEKLNVSAQLIYGIRNALEIEPCRKHTRRHPKMEQEKYDALVAELGLVRDNHLAIKYGISREYVRQLRLKYNKAKVSRQEVSVIS